MSPINTMQVIRGQSDQPAASNLIMNQDPEKANSVEQLSAYSDGNDQSADAQDVQPLPPPDGGLMAWVQVLLMHIVFFNTWGVANGFGIFQEYYSKTLDQSQSAISWIGSVQMFFLFLVGVVSGRATDAGYFKITFTLGVFLQVFGIFMTSLCTQYWQIFLSQAVCLGLGNGCTFCPALAVLSTYFKRNRALAVGLAAAGAATGGLVYPALINQLINHDDVGFPWAMRAMGFIMLATYLPCLIWFTPRIPPRKTGPWIDYSALREVPFVAFTLCMFLNFWGLYFAFFYMGTFARDKIHASEPANLIMVLNAVGIVGRIVPNIIAERWTGLLNITIPLSALAAILIYCWAAVTTEAGLYAFAIVNGFVAAALQALFPTLATTMSPDPSKAGTRVGMVLSVVGIALLIGPSISGILIERGHGDYLYAQILAGSVVFLGAMVGIVVRIAKGGWVLRIKV